MPLAGLVALVACGAQSTVQTVPLTLVPRGMTSHIGDFATTAVKLSTIRPAGLIRAPAHISRPLYGLLPLGGRRFFVVLATFNHAQRLFVDANANGDLSDDLPVQWKPKAGNANGSGAATVRLPFHRRSAPCNLIVIQQAPKLLSVLSDYGFAGQIRLGDRTMPFYLVDRAAKGFPGGDPSGSTLGIDRKGDGLISGPAEQYGGEFPFTINGASLVLRSVDLARATATFVPGEAVAEIPLPVELAANMASPTFTSQTLDGKPVHFPADFSSRVVLVYVWASWSKPSMEWLPRVAHIYGELKTLGFSVLGVCLNRATESVSVKAAVAQMPWTTAFDGTSWTGPAARAFSVTALPYVVLVNGKSGRIIATMDDMVGDKFDTVIRSAVVGGA
ncbi:MAG: TlpA family protein disulfide reductase [Fimbriimonadaceae bacterium]